MSGENVERAHKEFTNEEAMTILIRSTNEEPSSENTNCACAVCQARTTPQWRFVERQRVCNRCYMKLRKGSWNRHPAIDLELYCGAMGFDPSRAIRVGKFFRCPEEDPPLSPVTESTSNEPRKVCAMLIEDDVVSLPGLTWSRTQHAWRSSYLEMDTGEVKFAYFPVERNSTMSEEIQRIRAFDFKMRNVEEVRTFKRQNGKVPSPMSKASISNCSSYSKMEQLIKTPYPEADLTGIKRQREN